MRRSEKEREREKKIRHEKKRSEHINRRRKRIHSHVWYYQSSLLSSRTLNQKKLIMNRDSPLRIFADEFIQAAPDSQLSSSQSNLLSTLLKEEDQYEYNQLLNIQLPNNIQQILHQVRLFFINYLYHIFHFLLYYVVMFISSSFIFCYMDGYHLTQKTNYSTTFTRSLHNSCFYHTLTQISRFIITIYRLSTTCSILSHQ